MNKDIKVTLSIPEEGLQRDLQRQVDAAVRQEFDKRVRETLSHRQGEAPGIIYAEIAKGVDTLVMANMDDAKIKARVEKLYQQYYEEEYDKAVQEAIRRAARKQAYADAGKAHGVQLKAPR